MPGVSDLCKYFINPGFNEKTESRGRTIYDVSLLSTTLCLEPSVVDFSPCKSTLLTELLQQKDVVEGDLLQIVIAA